MTKIILELEEGELQPLIGLLDAGVKAVGIQGAEAGAHFLRKITTATDAYNEAKKTAGKPSLVSTDEEAA